MNPTRILPNVVLEELRKHDDWEIRPGGRHYKILINGRLAAIWPFNGGNDANPRRSHNVISYIRKARRRSGRQ